MTRAVATIGVYGFTAGTFIGALNGAGVGLLLDVRQPQPKGAGMTVSSCLHPSVTITPDRSRPPAEVLDD